MKPKRRRLIIVLSGMAALGIAVALILSALEENIVFFYSPTDLTEKPVPKDRPFRLGGLVEENSIRRGQGLTISFRVTDLSESVPVTYTGVLPDLFREGQGVIAEGRLGADGVFHATEILAKHDENYIPREVADALKKSGQWQGGGDQ